MGAAPVLRYKNVEVPRQVGEVARIRVLKGPDQGLIYLLRSSSITLGRGEDAGILISDLKASRAHARLDYTSVGWVVNDLGSANGIFYHGEYVRKFPVQSGEHFTIGDTIFEFLTSSESTRVLTSPLRPAGEMQQQEQALAAQRMRVKSLSQSAQIAPSANEKKSNPRTLLLLAGVGAAYYFMFMDTPKPVPAPKKQEKVEGSEKTLNSYLPAGVSKDVEKTAEQYYRQGFREFREENYLRARSQFELALQVNPNHVLARHYMISADKEIDTEIKAMISAAQKANVAGRLREAKGYYETAMRLMYYDRSNPDFVECEEGLKDINKELSRGP